MSADQHSERKIQSDVQGACVQDAKDRGNATVSPGSLPAELGGREGPEPTRFGDWEKNCRCVDF